MRRLFLANVVLLGLAVLFLGGCGEDESTGPEDVEHHFGTLSGVVENTAGSALVGVTVTAGALSAQTNEQGWFYLSDVPVGSATTQLAKDGYLTTYRNTTVLENQTTHIGTVVLIDSERYTIPAAVGGDVQTSDGDGVATFEAGSFVTDGGGPYQGDVAVEISAVLPDDEDFFEAFPGSFEGVRGDGSTVPFQSFGFMGVSLSDDAGARLQLAQGSEAGLDIRVPAELVATAPDTMPMWYFDESDGVWREEGFAVKQGDRYVAQVTHLTIWNWDYPLDDVCWINGRVVDTFGSWVLNARVISQGIGATYMDEDHTDVEGRFSVRAVKNTTASVWATKGTYASDAVSVDIGNESSVDLPDPLVLREPAYSIALRWGEHPSDLDSHLFIPMTWDDDWDFYHIYYLNMGTLGEDPFAALDTDDVTSYGPEIISGFSLYEGVYSYYVYLYSGSGDIATSPAVVDLQIAGEQRSYNASTASGTVGDFWHVFDFAVAPGGGVNITDANRFEEWDYSGYDVYGGSGTGLAPGASPHTGKQQPVRRQ